MNKILFGAFMLVSTALAGAAPASTPTERAGVRAGDLISTINGNRVDFGDELGVSLVHRRAKAR